MKPLPAVAVVVSLATASRATEACAGVVLDEATSGDFSDDRLAPTAVTLSQGTNVITGLSGQSPVRDMHDLDYVRFTVPDGHVLSRFVVQDAFVGGAFSFVAMQAGSVVTIPWDWMGTESPLLGWAHFGTSSIRQDILATMATSPGSVGFVPPLGPGTYTLWIMELNTSEPYRYRFGLEVTAIPAPAPAWLACALVRRPRRRSQ